MKRLLVAMAILLVVVSALDTPQAVSSTIVVAVPQTLRVMADLNDLPVRAKSYSVFDLETGEVLCEHNATAVLPIASITKLFTAAALLTQSSLPESFTVTEADVATEGRAGKLAVGQKYSPHELLFPLLLESSNDAAAVIGRNITLPPIVGVAIADPSGLSAQNQATAEGLAMAVRELYQSEPHIFDITKLSQMVGEYTGWVNNSPVRDLPGYRGGKHGYTEAANHTLVAIFAEDSLGGRELGYVILGSDDIRADTLLLRDAVGKSVRVE